MAELFHRCSQFATRSVDPAVGGRWITGRFVLNQLSEMVEYFRAVSGEHPDWDDYRQAMIRQGKCLISVEPERWGPIATGGFPPSLASIDELVERNRVDAGSDAGSGGGPDERAQPDAGGS